MDLSFYRNKRIFITGHTGFKGSWLVQILKLAGANITGYSLLPNTENNLYQLLNLNESINSVIGDIRDIEKLQEHFNEADPEIVFHLAAQPLVRESYELPRYTYETNVMGTVNILECVRQSANVKSFLNVTTDKVYENNEWEWGYREIDPLNGFDPYSNSKSCSELVTHSYNNSFFNSSDISISTARAGNVIGGGDFANDRIIPDCIRAAIKSEQIIVRNPYSTRPYQHVLEPLFAYLLIAYSQYENKNAAGWYNVGPDDQDCVSTGNLVDLFCKKWGKNLSWVNKSVDGPHEANFLKLDCSKIKSSFNWNPVWNIDMAIEQTCRWVESWQDNASISEVMNDQIQLYMKSSKFID